MMMCNHKTCDIEIVRYTWLAMCSFYVCEDDVILVQVTSSGPMGSTPEAS